MSAGDGVDDNGRLRPFRLAMTPRVLFVAAGTIIDAVNTLTLEHLWSSTPSFDFVPSQASQLVVHEAAGVLLFSVQGPFDIPGPVPFFADVTLVCMSIYGGRVMWTFNYTEYGSQFPVTVNDAGDTVYFTISLSQAQLPTLYALDTRTGVQRWTAVYVRGNANLYNGAAYPPIISQPTAGAVNGSTLTYLLSSFIVPVHLGYYAFAVDTHNASAPPPADNGAGVRAFTHTDSPPNLFSPFISPYLWYPPDGSYIRYAASGLAVIDMVSPMTMPAIHSSARAWDYEFPPPINQENFVATMSTFVDAAGTTYTGSQFAYERVGATAFDITGKALPSYQGQVGYCALCADRTLCCICTVQSNASLYRRLVVYTELPSPTPTPSPSPPPSTPDTSRPAEFYALLGVAGVFVGLLPLVWLTLRYSRSRWSSSGGTAAVQVPLGRDWAARTDVREPLVSQA